MSGAPDSIGSPAPGDIGSALLNWLSEPDGPSRWRGLWGEWRPADGDEEAVALAAEGSARHELLDVLTAITAESDQRLALALWYIRARAGWNMMNLQTGYEANAGFWNLPAIYGLSALSTLIGSIEPLLPTAFRNITQDLWAQATVQAVTPEQIAPQESDELATALPVGTNFGVHGENDALRDRLQQLRQLLNERDRERSLLAAEVGATVVADATEAARQKLRRLNSRVAEQAREIAQLRMERDEIVGHLPGREPATDAAEKIRALTQSVRQLEGRLAVRESDRRSFEKELGTSSAEDILAYVQELQSKEAKLRNRVSLLQTNGLFLLRELGGDDTDPGAVSTDDGWFWMASERARALKEAVADRAADLAWLRAQWERVGLETGTADPNIAADRIRALNMELRRVQSEVEEVFGKSAFDESNASPLPPLPPSLFGRRP